jgi:predicted DNA-binding transcriptional regulator YafY
MLTDKAHAICLLQILTEYSDENHPMPMREILSKMQAIYQIKPDRRTIYSSAALLLDLGYDISLFEENGTGYYLRGRCFETGEIRLLMDAVYSFPFIPEKQSLDLIEKLRHQLSVHERRRLNHLSITRESKKTKNPQVFYTIERLDEAINKKLKVKFTYLQYDAAKKPVARRAKKYTVNPYSMVYTNEHYYLVCSLAYQPKISLYRIDRMKDIEITEYALDEREPGFDPQQSVRQAVFAFTGERESITMLCDKNILDDVIDKFGPNIQIFEKENDKLQVQFTAIPEGIKYWALQYLQYVEVINPKWLREEIVESIKGNKYLKDGGY